MWNIWAQNAAIKNMQFSSEIDRKEGGGILNSGPRCDAGNIWCVWSGKWKGGCNEAEALMCTRMKISNSGIIKRGKNLAVNVLKPSYTAYLNCN